VSDRAIGVVVGDSIWDMLAARAPCRSLGRGTAVGVDMEWMNWNAPAALARCTKTRRTLLLHLDEVAARP